MLRLRERVLLRELRVDHGRSAMAVAGGNEGRRHVVAEQRDVGGMGAVGDTESPAGADPAERRGLDGGEVDVGKIDTVVARYGGRPAFRACASSITRCRRSVESRLC